MMDWFGVASVLEYLPCASQGLRIDIALKPILETRKIQLATPHGYTIMSGVVICIFGVIVCGRAGILKSRAQAKGGEGETIPVGSQLVKGLLVAFVSGILCACYSIAFSYGDRVMEISMDDFGNPGWRAAFAVSALILWGGAVSACGVCVFKLTRNKTWGTLKAPGIGKVLVIALIMAILHDGAILLFGVGASKLGPLGVAVGYAAFMSFAIIVGNINGFLTKEWEGAGRRSVSWIIAGILVLVIGVSVLAKGNFMQGEQAARQEEQAEGSGD